MCSLASHTFVFVFALALVTVLLLPTSRACRFKDFDITDLSSSLFEEDQTYVLQTGETVYFNPCGATLYRGPSLECDGQSVCMCGTSSCVGQGSTTSDTFTLNIDSRLKQTLTQGQYTTIIVYRCNKDDEGQGHGTIIQTALTTGDGRTTTEYEWSTHHVCEGKHIDPTLVAFIVVASILVTGGIVGFAMGQRRKHLAPRSDTIRQPEGVQHQEGYPPGVSVVMGEPVQDVPFEDVPTRGYQDSQGNYVYS